MNVHYIQFSDYSLLTAFLAQSDNQNILQCIVNPSQLNITRIKLNSISELEQYLVDSSGLWDDSGDCQDFLVDIQDVVLDTRSLEQATKIWQDWQGRIYLYSTINEPKADDKKLLKKFNINYQELKKIDTTIGHQLATNYLTKIGLNIPRSSLDSLVNQALGYNEIIDNLDFVQLSGDTELALKSLIKKEETALFMRGFNLSNLNKDTVIWAREVSDDNLQLALSLIYTKLDKNSSQQAKQLLQNLILTDQKIKTRSKIKALTWFQLFLWQAKMAN